MATSSQSPKLSDGWIPYLALTFVATLLMTELLISSLNFGIKTNIRNLVGLFFLGLMAYLFSKTDKKLAQEYLLPLLCMAVLFASWYVFFI